MNVVTLIICLLTVVTMIAFLLMKPTVTIFKIRLNTYWIIALVGAVIILCVGALPVDKLISGLTAATAINPIKILVLFLSMTLLSIFLDEMGFFSYLAVKTLKFAGKSQLRLFVLFYFIISVLTVFTSNDIIILTFTPFICCFSKEAKISPLPYLVTEFIAANTWSMLFIIGNPTNIYLCGTYGIDFFSYLSRMALPTLFCGLTSFALLLIVFRKKLKTPLEANPASAEIKNKPLLIIGIIHLACCIVLLSVSCYIGAEMWLVSLCTAGSLAVFVCAYSVIKKRVPVELGKSVKRAPWQLVPFILGMFTIALALNEQGITAQITSIIGESYPELKFGTISYLSANLINNIPMSVLFSSILAPLTESARVMGIYATVIGSNIGACLTPIGALAGIMWSDIIKNRSVKFGFGRFIKYCGLISIPTLFAAIGGLCLTNLH